VGGLFVSRLRLGRRGVIAATLAAPAILGRRARAAGTIQMISHRYPALEYYAEKMRTAVPGTTVNTQLMPYDKALELITIAMSSKSDTPDIVYASDAGFQTFVKNGWFRPLDDLWAKYRDEFKLDDFPDSVRKNFTHDGKLYVMPHTLLNHPLIFIESFQCSRVGLPLTTPPHRLREPADWVCARSRREQPRTISDTI
jgi:ABC-type glycerol-3-phosphate transport system substrate-binding protein